MRLIIVFSFLLAFLSCGFGSPPDADRQDTQGYSLDEAQKVLQAIEKIQAETLQPWDGPLREILITESEFNSYIAYRIESEREEIMTELRLKLLNGNKIEGKIHADLRGQKIPRFIRPEMDFYFAAGLQVMNGRARLDLKQLFLEDEPIQPIVLDLIMAISARLSNQEATSLKDWYELPYGIKDIKTQNGTAIFYY